MINLDMIGRMRDNKLYVGGSASGSNLKPMLEKLAPHRRLESGLLRRHQRGSSDHTSFTSHQVPALFFFSGLHGDYHKPSDTWDKIDAPAAAKLLPLVADVAQTAARAPERPAFVKVAAPRRTAAVPQPRTGHRLRPLLRQHSRFRRRHSGREVRRRDRGSPAAKAGLKAGDIMIEFDGKPMQNLYDFTYALRGKKPGDEVAVKVMRDGKPLTVKVLLARRP